MHSMTWQSLTPEYRLKVTFHTLTRQRVPSCRGPKAKFDQLLFLNWFPVEWTFNCYPLGPAWIRLATYWAIPYETLHYSYLRNKAFQNEERTCKIRLYNIDKQKQKQSEHQRTTQLNGKNIHQMAHLSNKKVWWVYTDLYLIMQRSNNLM